MAAGSLLALLDDIATVLDDVALMSKMAAKKTTGVLGDDLALNAQQVSGIRAERELPVVWAVTKGSLKNKLILVPAALVISAFAPWAILWLLMLGGAYLCFEGVEKLVHSWLHTTSSEEKAALHNALTDGDVDMVEFEKDKISGAIRTDFILSAEIIVITLGSISAAPFITQVLVVSLLAIAFTFGVYGIVAGIVKMDDVGLYLSEKAKPTPLGKMQKILGDSLLTLAPKLMKLLSVVGTAAMFMVGGGIIVHGVPALSELSHHIAHSVEGMIAGKTLSLIAGLTFDVAAGLIAGAIIVALFTGYKKISGQATGH
jgi:predicted DNA repair protein MutK